MISMPLVTEFYRSQIDRLPKSGNHIVAQYDAQSIVVYQAYRPAIGRFAAEHGYFGGEFKFERMSWIKPNFLWIMYRSGWGSKEGQEVVLAIGIDRSAFEEILAAAVHSKFLPEIYTSESEWKTAMRRSRRAIQLGLRDRVLAAYAKDWIVRIENISEFVRQQRQNFKSDCVDLVIPKETVYPVSDPNIAKKLGLSENTCW